MFLSLYTINIVDWITFAVGVSSEHCMIFSNIHGLYPQDARTLSPDIVNVPWGGVARFSK